jgi:hypothetical protein
MAVPSITSVSPDLGRTYGRQVVVLQGTDFAVPAPPPPTGYLGGRVQPTVRVTIGGRDASDVAIYSDGLLSCRLPRYEGDPNVLPLLVDVTVQNLDANGDPIVGEEFTLTDGFTYERRGPRTPEGAFKWILGRAIMWLRRHVVPEVATGTNTEYDDDPDALPLNVAALASLPGIAVVDVAVVRDVTIRDEQPRELDTDSPFDWELRRGPWVGRIEFTVVGVAHTWHEMMEMGTTLNELMETDPYVEVPTIPGDSGSETVLLPLASLTETEYGNQEQGSNVSTCRRTLAVEEVVVIPDIATSKGKLESETRIQREALS